MPKIVAVGCAVPPYKLTQSQIRRFAEIHFADSALPLDRLIEVFENAEIESRYFSVPIDWYGKERSFVEKNQAYIDSSTSLGQECAIKCLEQSRVVPSEIDYIIFVSTTGLATPSMDARLINLLGMRPDIRRTPIWGLGCAGGAAGLSHAHHYLLGHPRDRVLIVAVELCGLTFQQNDRSKSNFVATALFGEGAAAVLVIGDEVPRSGLEIIDTGSTFWPNSLDVMGWNLMNSGLQVVFAQSIPHIVETKALENFRGFLNRHELQLAQIEHFILHPGGTKVIEAYQRALGLADGRLELCRKSLREYGNMSAVSVLFVLEQHLQRFPLGSNAYGLISALGPGFCAENLLVRF